MTEHGTRSKYVNEGCRCAECREANTDYDRDHRTIPRNGFKTGKEIAQWAKAKDQDPLIRSEIAIERERRKRREEKEIEENLRETKPVMLIRERSNISPWAGLAGPMREGKSERRWWCPVGVSSN